MVSALTFCSDLRKPMHLSIAVGNPPEFSDFGITMRMGIDGGNPTEVLFGTEMLGCSR